MLQVREIESSVAGVRRQLADISAAVERKRAALEAALARLMEAHAGLDAALQWLDDAEARAASLLAHGASLSPPRLAQQITDHRAFAAQVRVLATAWLFLVVLNLPHAIESA